MPVQPLHSPPGGRSPLRLGLLLAACALAGGCAAGNPSADGAAGGAKPATAPTAAPGNVLTNPGFEDGRDGWSAMGTQNWGAFDIVDAPVRSGSKAAMLRVLAGVQDPQPVRVYGVVQEPRPESFPEVLSGWYRVDRWKRPVKGDMYVQVVVIVWGDPRTATIVNPRQPQPALKNYQIRYYLAGLEQPPFQLSNARLIFVKKGEPAMGEWVRFEIPVRKDFEEQWGVVPSGYEFIRVLFEARFDNRAPGDHLEAEVIYDDLYLGPSPAP